MKRRRVDKVSAWRRSLAWARPLVPPFLSQTQSPQSLVLIVSVLSFLLAGMWATVRITTNQLLYWEATSTAQDWGRLLALSVNDLREIAAGEQPSSRSMVFFEWSRNAGQVFRYEVFNRDGYSQLVANRSRVYQIDVSDFSAEAALSARTHALVVNVKEGESSEMPAFFSEAYIPVISQGETIAVVAAYVDQSAQRNRYRLAFIIAALTLCSITAIGFTVPVVAWYRRTREKQRADAKLHFLAHHDGLTRLANRMNMLDRLHCILERLGDDEGKVAVHGLDLDHFKEVNDTFGHDVGNALLCSVADRLRSVTRAEDIVARFGGDEFVIVQTSITHRSDAEFLATRIVMTMNEPFELGGHAMSVTASVGIAIAPDDGSLPEQLLKLADLALYRAKAQGRSCFRFFEPQMIAALQERLRIEKAIRDAVQNEGFALYFQPLVAVANGNPVGYEALLRLPSADGTIIAPAAFIPLAEEMGLISQIDEWVVRSACSSASWWPKHLFVAVNLSAVEFGKGAICRVVAEALKASGLEPSRLELEITETSLLKDTELVLRELHDLKQLGASIVMDDFGTGYSSLSYLWRFPFDKVKVDRSFMVSLGEPDRNVETIVKAIIDLGHSLNMRVTVEGIEEAAQVDLVRELGCDEIQGFYFSRPISSTDLAVSMLGRVADAELARDRYATADCPVPRTDCLSGVQHSSTADPSPLAPH